MTLQFGVFVIYLRMHMTTSQWLL